MAYTRSRGCGAYASRQGLIEQTEDKGSLAKFFKNYRQWLSSSYVKDGAAIAFITASIGFIYRRVLEGHESLLTNSNLGPPGPLFIGDPAAGGEITAYKEFAVTHAWLHFHLPIWLPIEGYGISLDSNQAAPWFFPEIIFHVLFPTNLSIWNVVALILGAYGTYLLARELKIKRPGAIAASLAYPLIGPAVANLNLDMINPLMMLPFAIFTSIRLVEALAYRRSRLLWILAFTFTMSQLFLSGFAEVLPLESLVIGLFTLARILTLGVGLKVRAQIVGNWVLSVVAAVVSSLVATVPLWETLKSYTLLQPPGSSLVHEPRFFLIDVFDAWTFGKGIAGDPLELGNTIWVPGNPVIYAIALSATVYLALSWKRTDRWHRTWLATSSVLVAFGLLGFGDLLGVLNAFRVPPFDLIYTPRFLPFMWWLPMALLIGYGVDAATKVSKSTIVLSYGVISSVILILVVNLFRKGPTIFAILNSQNLDATIVRNVPVLLLTIGALGVTVCSPKRQRSRISAVFIILTAFVMLPKNFFDSYQAPQQAKALGNFLVDKGLSQGLTFSPADYVLPSGLLGRSIPSIQAFDVFFPPGYTVTLEHWFGTENPFATQSPLYPGAPALENIVLDYNSLDALVRIGVETLIVHTPIAPDSLANLSVLPKPSFMSTVSSSKYYAAMSTLLNLYLSRPDLQAAIERNTINVALLKWALNTPAAGDGAQVVLSPYFPIYSRFLSGSASQPSVSAFNISSPVGDGLVSLKFVGKTFFGPTPEYVYDIARGANKNALWVPRTLRFYQGLSQSHPVALDTSFVAVPKNFVGTNFNQRTLSVEMVSFRENASSLTTTLVANHKGLVVLRRQVSPGERLFINGRQVPLTLANGFLTGIPVQRGTMHVVLEYASTQVVALFALDLVVNVLFVLAMLLILGKRKLRKLVSIDHI